MNKDDFHGTAFHFVKDGAMTRRLYGTWFDDPMRQRLRRDKEPWATRVIVRQRHYAVRGYVHDATEDHNVHYYHMRRDGKVQCSLLPRTDVIVYGEEILP